ncbi:MAG: hypothetical protein GXY70_04435 [Euryarchaeota archaeon]|nr:hypothetical protein [Euryarchaeota archaeon]
MSVVDVPEEIEVLLDALLKTVPTILLSVVALIIGYILAYVAGDLVRRAFKRTWQDRPVGMSGLNLSVVAGKFAKALVFALAAILAIHILANGGAFGNQRVMVEDYGTRAVLAVLVMFVGAFVADMVSSTVALWLRRGASLPEEIDPTRDLVFLGLIVSVVLVGLGIVFMDNLAVLLMFLAFLAIGVLVILIETRRKMG